MRAADTWRAGLTHTLALSGGVLGDIRLGRSRTLHLDRHSRWLLTAISVLCRVRAVPVHGDCIWPSH